MRVQPLTGVALHFGSDSQAPLDLLPEEGTLKRLRLRGRESCFREHLDDLIRECPLFRRKHRRVSIPTQASTNVRVDPRPFTRDLVRQSMQVSNLIKQRLKLFVGNRHNRRRVRPPLDESCLTSHSTVTRQPIQIGSTVAGVRVLVVGGVVLLLVSCGRTEPEPSRESSPDPKQLVVRLSDLPPRFTLVAGELLRPTPLENVLADPWSAGLEAEIKRERVSGVNTSVWSPEGRRIQCSVAVYRSSTGARQILEHSRSRFRAFLAAQRLGRPILVGALGEETSAFRFNLGRLKGLAITWRHRSVLATCSILGREPPALAELAEVVSAQQMRLATMLG